MEKDQKPKSSKPKKSLLETKRELARICYLQGESQKAVALRVGVSPQSVNRWVRDGGWEELRAAKSISRHELVAKMLKKINQRLDSDDWTADEIIKAAKAVEKLDKDSGVVTVMEVFSAFGNWLSARMQTDPDLSPETVRVITAYQDAYISEILSKSKLNLS